MHISPVNVREKTSVLEQRYERLQHEMDGERDIDKVFRLVAERTAIKRELQSRKERVA